MKKTNWKDIVELIGIAAIVASLIFVGMQLVIDQRIAETQSYIDSAQLTHDQVALVADHRDIWVSGLDGGELSAADEVVFQGLIHSAFQRKVAVWQRRLRLDAGQPDDWEESFAWEIYIYPGLRRVWGERVERRLASSAPFGRSITEGGFTYNVQSVLAELDRLAPRIPAKKSYILR